MQMLAHLHCFMVVNEDKTAAWYSTMRVACLTMQRTALKVHKLARVGDKGYKLSSI